jgi:hypothetical protein
MIAKVTIEIYVTVVTNVTTVTRKSISALVNMATMAKKLKITATAKSTIVVALVTEKNIGSG